MDITFDLISESARTSGAGLVFASFGFASGFFGAGFSAFVGTSTRSKLPGRFSRIARALSSDRRPTPAGPLTGLPLSSRKTTVEMRFRYSPTIAPDKGHVPPCSV